MWLLYSHLWWYSGHLWDVYISFKFFLALPTYFAFSKPVFKDETIVVSFSLAATAPGGLSWPVLNFLSPSFSPWHLAERAQGWAGSRQSLGCLPSARPAWNFFTGNQPQHFGSATPQNSGPRLCSCTSRGVLHLSAQSHFTLSFLLHSPQETCNNNQDALPYCLNTLMDILRPDLLQ